MNAETIVFFRTISKVIEIKNKEIAIISFGFIITIFCNLFLPS